jgi:hypothetical protein
MPKSKSVREATPVPAQPKGGCQEPLISTSPQQASVYSKCMLSASASAAWARAQGLGERRVGARRPLPGSGVRDPGQSRHGPLPSAIAGAREDGLRGTGSGSRVLLLPCCWVPLPGRRRTPGTPPPPNTHTHTHTHRMPLPQLIKAAGTLAHPTPFREPHQAPGNPPLTASPPK